MYGLHRIDTNQPVPESLKSPWIQKQLLRLWGTALKASYLENCIVIAIAYWVIWYCVDHTFSIDFKDVENTVTTLFVFYSGILLCLIMLIGFAGRIAVHEGHNRSLIVPLVYTATLVVIFARLYASIGVMENSILSKDFISCLYFSMVTFTNLGYGDVTPSKDTRFIAASEGFTGYIVLAFVTAVFLSVIQRGMALQALRAKQYLDKGKVE